MPQVEQSQIAEKLRLSGLRPTRQRVALAELLFRSGDRHVTAEDLHEEAVGVEFPVSLATVYNTLNQFTTAGLLRIVAIDGAKTYFDTNTSNHYHFYLEDEGRLLDIPANELRVVELPEAPEGSSISGIDVIVRLSSRKQN